MKRAKRFSLADLRARRLCFALLKHTEESVPQPRDFEHWLFAVASGLHRRFDIALMLCDEEAARAYNRDYRGQDRATNVLSFVSDDTDAATVRGDLVICPQVVRREAAQQGKTEAAHYAHLTIHGALHLAGFDHETDEEAEEMEATETTLLRRLGIANPY